MILFNDLNIHDSIIKKEINSAIKSVIESGWFVLGPQVENFENEFAAYIGTKFCVGVASGTEAIALALLSLEISQSDEVITTNVTAYPSIVGIVQSGAKPVVVDIFSDTGLMDYNRIEAKINARTKAIMPVHLYGQSCDMEKIMQIADKNHLQVIEDCAQSTGTTFKNKKTGCFGKCSAFSFYPTKNLGAIGDGGAVVTNDRNTYEKLLMLRNYGQSVRYKHDHYGINSRLDEIQAAILRIRLKYVDEWNEKRRNIARFYIDNIKTAECLKLEAYGKSNFHLFLIKTPRRDQFMEYLKIKGIQTLIHYPIPINKQKAFPDQKEEIFDVSHKFTNEIFSIPLYPDIKKTSLVKIVKTINEFRT